MGETTRKKRVKFLGIDVEPVEVALIVKYEVEVVATTDGVAETESRQSTQTKIRVKTLSESSNVEKLAKQIAEKCKLIPDSKVPLVVNKLYELQFAVTNGGGDAAAAPEPEPPQPEPDYGAQDAEREREEREERDRQYREEMQAREEDDRRQREQQDMEENRRREDEERERAQQRELMDRERHEEQMRDEERARATERERAAYNGFDDEANGWSQPPKEGGPEGGRYAEESSPDGGVSSGWGDGDAAPGGPNPEEERARRAAEDAERERERQRRAQERERKEKEWEEQEARRSKEKEESEAEHLKQQERQKEWATQRSEAIELQKEDEVERVKEQNQMEKIRKQMDKVSFDKLDDYIEQLYDDDSKVKGTHKILLLARNPDHLEELLMNETLLGVLSRLFREDTRKSIDLSINIAYIFYSFSVYSKFHATVSQHRVGALTFKSIELETERSVQMMNEMAQSETQLKSLQPGSRDEEVLQKKIKKMRSVTRKQDKLLTVCFHILLNLAEDTKVEKKMKKMKIIPHLIALLQRRNLELRQLAVMFLKKLSIFRENVVEMAQNDIIGKLAVLIPNDHQPLLIAVLRLLLNLSFDTQLRTKMTMMDFAPKIAESFKRARGPRSDGAASELALTMLYQLSTDPGTRHKFRHTECIPLVVGMLSQGSGGTDRTAVALAINLSLAPGNAEQLAAKGQLRTLVRNASQSMDNCLLKLIRNLSAHDLPYREEFRAYVDELLAMCDFS